eukprot:Partr_v1_DN23776_c1_g1_i2_m53069 putative Tctex1 domain containing
MIRFNTSTASSLIADLLTKKLAGRQYSSQLCAQWTRELVDEVKLELKSQTPHHYRFVVTAVVGEMKGEGVRMDARCFWDTESDACVHQSYTSEQLFANVSAFAIYHY